VVLVLAQPGIKFKWEFFMRYYIPYSLFPHWGGGLLGDYWRLLEISGRLLGGLLEIMLHTLHVCSALQELEENLTDQACKKLQLFQTPHQCSKTNLWQACNFTRKFPCSHPSRPWWPLTQAKEKLDW